MQNTYITKLINSLIPLGISFYETDGTLNNVVFERNGKTMKIAYDMFFRHSGRCMAWDITKKNTKKGVVELFKFSPITDEEFYELIRIMVIIKLINNNNK